MRLIRLLIADDHPVVRDGLRAMLATQPDMELVGEAATGTQAVAQARALRPDVVLMDLQMPELDGPGAIATLREQAPEVRVLVLTTYGTDADITRAVDAGATGYLLKDAPREQLFGAIRAAARGESVLSPLVATRVLGRMRAPAEEALSPRELEILQAVARGLSNKGHRPPAVRQRGDGQDPPAASLQQARGRRPHRGSDRRPGTRHHPPARLKAKDDLVRLRHRMVRVPSRSAAPTGQRGAGHPR
jgi:DNA-binding NarL/FixJ family response regulator